MNYVLSFYVGIRSFSSSQSYPFWMHSSFMFCRVMLNRQLISSVCNSLAFLNSTEQNERIGANLFNQVIMHSSTSHSLHWYRVSIYYMLQLLLFFL